MDKLNTMASKMIGRNLEYQDMIGNEVGDQTHEILNFNSDTMKRASQATGVMYSAVCEDAQ